MDFTGADAVFGAKLLLMVGILDVLVGLAILIKPIRIVLLWAVIWTTWTSVMRILPFIGDPIWEFMEKIIMPLASLTLLMLRGWPTTFREWFK